jgi:uncharacterized protein YndB with AHSA1/START domain
MSIQALAPVTKAVTVDVPQQRAFEFFTQNFSEWWPMEGHCILEGSTAATLEPREGGRWYEFGGPQGECDWGHVLAYEPPRRLLLAGQLDASWRYDPAFLTEVEVRFVAESETSTRVELEHRGMDRFGAEVRASFDGDGGWGGLLAAYAKALAT